MCCFQQVFKDFQNLKEEDRETEHHHICILKCFKCISIAIIKLCILPGSLLYQKQMLSNSLQGLVRFMVLNVDKFEQNGFLNCNSSGHYRTSNL